MKLGEKHLVYKWKKKFKILEGRQHDLNNVISKYLRLTVNRSISSLEWDRPMVDFT